MIIMEIILNILFSIVLACITGMLIRYNFQLRNAINLSQEALYPSNEDYHAIRFLPEMKTEKPLKKDSRGYRLVQWTTVLTICLFVVFVIVTFTTNWFHSSYFTLSVFFYLFTKSIKLQDSFFIVKEGIVMNGNFHHYTAIDSFGIEEIKKWHKFYGLHEDVNHGYHLEIKLKKRLFSKKYSIIITDKVVLQKIATFLENNVCH